MFWPFLAIINENLKQEESCIKYQCVSSLESAITASISISILHLQFGHTKMQKLFHVNKFCMYHTQKGTRIANHHGLDGPGFESRGGDFLHPSRLALGVKWPGHGIDHPPTCSVDIKERVEL